MKLNGGTCQKSEDIINSNVGREVRARLHEGWQLVVT